MKLCLLDSQRREFAFPLKRLYDVGVRKAQEYSFKRAIPYIKKNNLTVICMDYKTERLLQAEKIPCISLKHLTENLWDYENGVRAMDEVKNLSKHYTKHKILYDYHGIDLIDMNRMAIWRSHYLPRINLIHELNKIMKRERPTEVIIFNRTNPYQKILKKVAFHYPCKVEDKTTIFHRLGEKTKKTLIRKLAWYNVPESLRMSRVVDKSSNEQQKTKNQKPRALVIHDTIQPKKVTAWTKLLKEKYDVTFVGMNQESEPFEKEGIPYKNILTYLDSTMLETLKKAKHNFAQEEPRLTKLTKIHPFVAGLKYQNVLLWDSIEELFAFFSHARFYQTATYIELFERIISIEKPQLIVTVDEMSTFGRTLCAVAKKQKVACMIVQPGLFGQTPLLDMTNCKKILVYGESTKKNMTASGTPASAIKLVGIPEECNPQDSSAALKEVRAHFNISQKKIFLFTTQGLGEGYNYKLFDTVYKAMPKFSDIFFLVKIHPAENDLLHKEFIDKYKVKNVHVIRHGEYPLEKALDACHCLLNFYSTVGFEAMVRGKFLISINVTGIPSFMLPQDAKGLIVTVNNHEDLIKAITEFAKKKPAPEAVKAAAQQDVYAVGKSACDNVVKELWTSKE